MPQFRRIDSLEDPALAPYLTLRRSDEHERTGVFVADGPKLIERVLAAGLTLESMLCSERWVAPFTPLLARQVADLPVYVTDEKHLRQLVGFHLFNGVLAVARIPVSPSLATLLAQPAAAPRLWVALDGLANAENLGSIVRSAVALGAQAVLCGETCASPWLRRAVRTSMGAMVAVPVLQAADLAADLRACATAGLTCAAADAHSGTSLPAAKLDGDLCLVFGSEGHGLRPAVAAACTTTVNIPMTDRVSSLNVGAAAAIMLYEAARQRRPLPPP